MSALLLTRADIAALMRPCDYLEAVEAAFRLAHAGRAPSPPPMHIEAIGGAFHAKGAALFGDRPLAALKLNGNFPGNPVRGLPTIQGVILLCDAETGAVLAIMDSIEITLRRTAAASALAAKHLARSNARTLAIVGCGAQAGAQLEALAEVFQFEAALVCDADHARAETFASTHYERCGFTVKAVQDVRSACRDAEVIVTCTTARAPVLDLGDVRAGAFIAAVGADNSEKSEIAPALMAAAAVVVDVLSQCRVMGDLHHALKAGAMGEVDVRGELAEMVAGTRAGRVDVDEVVIFDSTGTALQDAASAAVVYARARALGMGRAVALA